MATDGAGLGNQAILGKIDKLRELNVGAIIPLPQLVVVGDQSSGKSSVLESLTGFSFPRAAGLCTRYVTQITCCRDAQKSVLISIIPRPDADKALKEKLVIFQRRITELDNDALAEIFNEANAVMGIRMNTSDDSQGVGAFSQDILNIEISGPDQEHLTVIDVPGIFRVPTPGLTTETDITLVENMVKSNMSNNRTIILAVMPCNVDIATQEILKLAEAADPAGVRTMGVLTKPDLATETATKSAVIDLVLGKRSILKLGCYIVKNRSADDNTSTLSERAASENPFFMASPWSNAGDRCGIAALKGRLRHFLMSISKQEFPHVKSEIEQRLRRCKKEVEIMGPSRGDQNSQRLFLGKLASRFQMITQAALNAYHTGDTVLKTDANLRLITKLTKLNEDFSRTLSTKGHKRYFASKPDGVKGKPASKGADGASSSDEDDYYSNEKSSHVSEAGITTVSWTPYPELHDIIIVDEYECPNPLKEPIIGYIENEFASSRGADLGTFGGTILARVFEEQSEKWQPLALSHASNAITLVHDYIFRLLTKLCPEKLVLDQLWARLVDNLTDSYRKAMDHARFLLHMERGGRPITFNHYFNSNLQKKRAKRLYDPLKAVAMGPTAPSTERYIPASKLEECVVNRGNSQQICEDILDTLVSYYKVARKRFVDVVCQQVVYHQLLDGGGGPLKVFCPDLVMNMSPEQLELIAGEDAGTRHRRQALTREIDSLESAVKVLRG